MDVSIHINHASQDDLTSIESLAAELGFATAVKGEFLGRNVTEFRRTMNLQTLQELIKAAEHG